MDGPMMPPRPPLRSVLLRLSSFSHKEAPHGNHDDECIICHENYFPIASDGCHPVKLMPCGHVIGHECFLHWISETGTAVCCLCQRRVWIESVPLHLKPLQYISHTYWYMVEDNMIADLQSVVDVHERDQLLEGKLTVRGSVAFAGKLMVTHALVSAVFVFVLMALIGVPWWGLAALDALIRLLFGHSWPAFLPRLRLFLKWVGKPIGLMGVIDCVVGCAVSWTLVFVGMCYHKKFTPRSA